MTISHLTSTAVFQSGTGNRTVTPNASAAIGDVLVLPVGFQDSSATTIGTPTGWTVQKSAVLTGTLKSSLLTRARQSGDTTWVYAPNQSVETAHLVLSIGGGDPASLLIGADGTRAASGGTTNTTAPSITTTVANTRVYVISTERTTANETVEATVNNGFTKILHTFANGTSAESLFIGYKDIVTPGAVGATTVTFQNSQATNGYAVLIAIAPASTALDISGTVAVVTTISATVAVQQTITGSAPVATGTAATLTVTMAIVATVSAESGAQAAFAVTGAVSGSAAVSSVAIASVSSRQGFSAGAASTSSVVGALIVSRTIASTVAILSGFQGAFGATQDMLGTATVTSTTTAEFTVGQYVPPMPVPDLRTLTGTWSTQLDGTAPANTLNGVQMNHTLEDA